MTPLERKQKYRRTPRGSYSLHKGNAKRRGLAFTLSFEQWWKLWWDSGHWEERGPEPGSYVMCRRGDSGGYTENNVYIGTSQLNLFDAAQKAAVLRMAPRSGRHTWESLGLPAGF